MLVTGDVDLAALPLYRRELHDAVAGAKPLEIDLSECDFMDSTGLGVTIGAVRRVWDRDGEVRIVTSPPVQRLMTRCRLDEILPLTAPSVQSADPGQVLAPSPMSSLSSL